MKKIAVGCDPNASALKAAIIEHLETQGLECEDYGSDDPVYANTAIRVAEAVAAGRHERGTDQEPSDRSGTVGPAQGSG